VIDHDMIACWKVNYGLDTRTPADAMRYWDERCNGMAPAGAVAALGLCIEHIERLRAELAEARRDAEHWREARRSAIEAGDALMAELTEAQRERDLLREFMRDVCADLKCEQNDEAALLAIEALREEVERLRRDAERYRWLRRRNELTAADDPRGPFVIDLLDDDVIHHMTGAEIDAAIDAARGEP
jgi:hypothetical protein